MSAEEFELTSDLGEIHSAAGRPGCLRAGVCLSKAVYKWNHCYDIPVIRLLKTFCGRSNSDNVDYSQYAVLVLLHHSVFLCRTKAILPHGVLSKDCRRVLRCECRGKNGRRDALCPFRMLPPPLPRTLQVGALRSRHVLLRSPHPENTEPSRHKSRKLSRTSAAAGGGEVELSSCRVDVRYLQQV